MLRLQTSDQSFYLATRLPSLQSSFYVELKSSQHTVFTAMDAYMSLDLLMPNGFDLVLLPGLITP